MKIGWTFPCFLVGVCVKYCHSGHNSVVSQNVNELNV